jgi:hypothetical protein
MSGRSPTLQQLWPSLSMATPSMNPNLGAAAPYGSVDSPMRWVHLLYPLLGVPKPNHKKTESGIGFLALGGHHSVILHNNQPKDSVGSGEGIQEDTRPGRNVWGTAFARHLGH